MSKKTEGLALMLRSGWAARKRAWQSKMEEKGTSGDLARGYIRYSDCNYGPNNMKTALRRGKATNDKYNYGQPC